MGKRLLKITETFLVDHFGQDREQHYKVIDDGLPPDARIVDCEFDPGTIVLVLESAEWEPTAPGEDFPEVRPLLASRWAETTGY